MDLKKPLYKSRKNKIIDGVCGGIGEYFGIDPTLVRLGFVGLCVLAGGGLLAYVVALIIIPQAPEGYDPTAQDEAKADSNAKASDANTEAAASHTDAARPTEDDSDGDKPTMI